MSASRRSSSPSSKLSPKTLRTHPIVKPMEGEYAGCHRLRHGGLRVIYQWDKAQDTLVVLAIGPRGDIYK